MKVYSLFPVSFLAGIDAGGRPIFITHYTKLIELIQNNKDACVRDKQTL